MIYDLMRRATLRDFAWSFAHKVATLGLVTESGDALHPTDEYTFAYRQPSDCLQDRKIQSGIRNDNRQSRVPYKVSRDSTGGLILTDREDAILEYTIDIQEVQLYPDDFVLALSLRIATYVAPKIAGADPFKMRDTCAKLYRMEIESAKSNSLNEQQVDEDPESELIRARS